MKVTGSLNRLVSVQAFAAMWRQALSRAGHTLRCTDTCRSGASLNEDSGVAAMIQGACQFQKHSAEHPPQLGRFVRFDIEVLEVRTRLVEKVL